jgi:hypothetical protein
MRKLLAAAVLAATAFVLEGPAPARAAIQPAPERVEAWAFCGVRPSDPTAQTAANAMADHAGITATFGPCNVPDTAYTPVDPVDRYVSPATYMQLVLINAEAGMKTLVYDARIYSTNALQRDAAIAFWSPVKQHIAAWDLGDEYQPTIANDWNELKLRWNRVRTFVTPVTGIKPYTNHLIAAVDKALIEIPDADELLSFTQYTDDLGASVARTLDARVDTLMCGINAYEHLIFEPTPTSIREGMYDLIEAGCDRFLVFGGQRVYDTTDFGEESLVDRDTGAPTSWATAVLEGSGRSGYEPVGPARVLETRPGLPTADGLFAGVGPRLGGTETALPIAGRAGVRTGARAVALNLTVTNATSPGFVTAYPCGTPRPLAAQVNFPARTDLATAVVVKLASDGRLCLYTPVDTDLVIDVSGFYPDGAAIEPLQPARLLETRADPGLTTVDGRFLALGPSEAASVTELQVTGRGGVPTGAGEALLNVTVTAPRGPGFVTVYPCDGGRPTASNLNYVAGATVTNAVISPLGASGRVCLFTLAPADLVVDVNGYVPGRSSFVSLTSARLMDTRPDEGITTVDGQQARLGLRPAGTTTSLIAGGRAGVPTGASAVVLNLTVTNAAQAGFVTAWPCGEPRPLASNLNLATGTTVANLVVAEVGQNDSVCLFTSVAAHLVVDIAAYHP